MNRLQKKCIIVSAGIHLLLAVMVILGSAFLAAHSQPEATQPLDFIPLATIDAALSGGGDNTVKAPPAQLVAPPEPPAPVAPPTPVVDRTPPAPVPVERPIPTPKEPQIKPPNLDIVPVLEPKRTHKIEVSTVPVVGTSTSDKAAKDAKAKAQAAVDAKRLAAAKAFGRAISGIQNGVSGSTEVRFKGRGGGGVPYGNFFSGVQKVYEDAWTVPDGAPDLTVSVTVTVARDGTVVSARITDGSGNSALDNSVHKALDRVKSVPPLPESETSDTRTFTIGFNPEIKRAG
jgi:TonB family protein